MKKIRRSGCIDAATKIFFIFAMLISGACHCGNISFSLNWQPEPTEIPARACTCSFCVKHGGVWTACSGGSLVIAIQEEDRHSKYAFGTRTADFHICSNCGVVPVVTSTINRNIYAVVSVNAMEGIPSTLFKYLSVSFAGEDEAARLQRRITGWIADVRFTSERAA